MMDGRPAGLPLHEVRALSRSLAAARDEQVIRVVEMVDALDRRDAADGILAPLRPRLAQMRPARPLRFARLLFMPLDSVIVPAAGWRPGSATVPRTALGPLAAAVRSALGPAARDIDAAIAGCSAGDRRIVGLTGAGLWPRAGAVLAAAPALDGWAATGLPPAAAPDICRAAGAVLLAAVHLRRLAAEAAIGVRLEPEPLHAILAGPAQSGSEALAMAVAVLLAMLPQAAALLPRGASVIGPDGNALMRVAAGQAAEVLLGRLEAQGGSGTLAAANCLDEASA